jgi:glycosyltransferase involved in cell wall biosynthesis
MNPLDHLAALQSPTYLSGKSAWLEHIPFVSVIVNLLSPAIFVELGSHYGDSYLAFCEAVKSSKLATRCFAVDTWQGDEHASHYGEEVYNALRLAHDPLYTGFSSLLRMTFDQAASSFADGSIDLLHIDGLHTYEAVKHDFDTWHSKLSDKAVVLFHDSNVRERDFGVWKFWAEISKQYPSFEFHHGHGLGVLGVGKALPLQVKSFLEADVEKYQQFLRYFSSLGAAITKHQLCRQSALDIEQLKSALEDKDRHIGNIESNFGNQKNQSQQLIGQLQSDVTSKNDHILNLEALHLGKQKQDSQLINQLQANQAKLQERLIELEKVQVKFTASVYQTAELKNLVDERTLEIQEYSKVVVDRDTRIATHLAALEAIKKSSSWKMTAPFRFFGHQIKRVLYLARLLPQQSQRLGGPLALTHRAATVLRTQGVDGLKKGVAHAGSPAKLAAHAAGIPDHGNNYAAWVEKFDKPTESKRQYLQKRMEQFSASPKISILMPTYNPPLKYLKAAIASVIDQVYSNWELCIADDCSTDPSVAAYLQALTADDSRIKVTLRTSNGHISAASNSALEISTGDFVALLDQDDLLAYDALFWIVAAINEHPQAQLLYSDEDKIDDAGTRTAPYFKSDWNPDLILSHNMFSHLGVYKSTLMRSVGGFKLGLEGSQDFDLVLRCSEQVEPAHIIHVPKVLYHWRAHPGSTALASSEKNYAILAGKVAIEEHLKRKRVQAQVSILDIKMYRVRYHLPEPQPLVSLIIPTRNGLHLLRQCLESILTKTQYKNFEIIVVDNNSDDPECLAYLSSLQDQKVVKVLRDERPFNYSQLNNSAAKLAKGQYLGLINNDIEVISPLWLEEMVGLAMQPDVGAVGARLWYPNHTLQHAGCVLGILGVAGHAFRHLGRNDPGYFGRAQVIQSLSAVTAACLVIKKSIFDEVNGLDEVNLKVAFNDVDFCIRVRDAGYRNVWTPYAELFHHESATRGIENTPAKQERFSNEVNYMLTRWKDALAHDPAYNLNLSLAHEDFSLAWPPRRTGYLVCEPAGSV